MEARDISRSRTHPFQIALRVRHPSIDPETISRELKLTPEHSFRAGEPRESTSGNALTSVHAETYWFGSLSSVTPGSLLSGFSGARASVARERLQSPASAESLTLALDASVIAFLRPHAEFIRRIHSEDGQVSLLIELSARALNGFSLSPQFTRVTGDLGMSIEFEFVNT